MKNSSLGASFALMKIFGRLTDSKSSFAPKNFHKYKTSTANTRICDSNQGNPKKQRNINETTKIIKSTKDLAYRH